MKKILFACLILILFANSILFANQNIGNNREAEAAEALGYIYGQEYILDMISKKYPELREEVNNAKKKFRTSFGKTKANLEKDWIRIFGTQGLNRLKAETEGSLEEFINQENIVDKKYAKQYIKEVKSRAGGENIINHIKQTLLKYKHSDKHLKREAKKDNSPSIFKDAEEEGIKGALQGLFLGLILGFIALLVYWSKKKSSKNNKHTN